VDTCHTFSNEREAAAFMMGYQFGQRAGRHVGARIDPEERFTVLVDCDSDKADRAWMDACQDFKQLEIDYHRQAVDCVTSMGDIFWDADDDSNPREFAISCVEDALTG
jgi:hypothetical protein